MTRDMTPWVFGHMVDHAVEVLIPRGSCSRDRWLTFDLEAVGDDDQTFRYLLQYRATSNYVDWRVVVPDSYHFRKSNRHDFDHEDDGWVNIDKMSGAQLKVLAKMCDIPVTWVGTTFKREQILEQIRATRTSEAPTSFEMAPGYVVASGSHDSCWRDNALTLEGCPRTLPEGAEYRERTVWMRSMRIKEIIVHSMKVEGPTGGMWKKDIPKWEKFTDGEWVNPAPVSLTGAWAVITGLACLYKTTAATEPLQVDLDTSLQYYREAKDGEDADRWGRVRTSEKRITVAYKIDHDGELLTVGHDRRKVGLPLWDWSPVNIEGPISRSKHLGFCKVPAGKQLKGLVDINSMWAR